MVRHDWWRSATHPEDVDELKRLGKAFKDAELGPIQLLIEGKSRLVYEKFKHGQPILTMAAKLCDDRVLEWLLGRGADVRATNANGSTPLFECAYHGRLEGALLLIQRGGDPAHLSRGGYHFVQNLVFGGKGVEHKKEHYCGFLGGLVNAPEWASKVRPAMIKAASNSDVDERLDRFLTEARRNHSIDDSIRRFEEAVGNGFELKMYHPTEPEPKAEEEEEEESFGEILSVDAALVSFNDYGMLDVVPTPAYLAANLKFLSDLGSATPTNATIDVADREIDPAQSRYTFLAREADNDPDNEQTPKAKRQKNTFLKWQSYTASSSPKPVKGTSHWVVSRALSGFSALQGRMCELLERAPDDYPKESLEDDYPIICTEKYKQTRTPHRYRRATPWCLVIIRPKPGQT